MIPEKPDKAQGVDLYALLAEHKSQKYSVEDKLRVVMKYVVEGNLKKVARETGLPYDTIKDWRHTTEWWDVAINECRRRKQDELDSTLTGLIEDALGQVADRIHKGDTVRENGTSVRIPMKGKEVATVAGILFDKRAAMRGDPTSITRHQTPAEHIQQLEHKFEEFSKKMRAAGNLAEPIEVEDGN